MLWITGASTGIGRAVALRYARAGWTVAASARDASALAALAADASGLPGRIMPVPLDVTDLAACKAVVERIERESGAIDSAILNAGTHLPVDARTFSSQTFRKLFEVNVFGAVHGIEALLPVMLARRRGQIAIVASVAGYRGLPTASAYGASKAALINMAEALHLDLAGQGVDVRLVCPGFVKTPLTDRNPFPMPFLMEADAAADRMFRGLSEGRSFEITFPRRFTWFLKVLERLPYALYFPLVKRATS